MFLLVLEWIRVKHIIFHAISKLTVTFQDIVPPPRHTPSATEVRTMTRIGSSQRNRDWGREGGRRQRVERGRNGE